MKVTPSMPRAAILALVLWHCHGASAQPPFRFRVLVAGCENRSRDEVVDVSAPATDAIYREMGASRGVQLSVVNKQDVLTAARRIGLTVSRSHSGLPHWSLADRIRLACNLHADVILESQVSVLPPRPERAMDVALGVQVREVASRDYFAFAFAEGSSVNGAVTDAVRQLGERHIGPASVLRRERDRITFDYA